MSDLEQRVKNERYTLEALTGSSADTDTILVSTGHLRRISDLLADLAWPDV